MNRFEARALSKALLLRQGWFVWHRPGRMQRWLRWGIVPGSGRLDGGPWVVKMPRAATGPSPRRP